MDTFIDMSTVQEMSKLSPAFITVFLCMTSMVNQDVKALVWLAIVVLGILMVSLFRKNSTGPDTAFATVLGMDDKGGDIGEATPIDEALPIEKASDKDLPLADVTAVSFKRLMAFYPYPSSFFIMFTLIYMIIPMQLYSSWNYYIIMTLLLFFAVDTMVKLNNKSASKNGVVLGALAGLLYGGLWIYILYTTNATKFLYFTGGKSNNTTCSKPTDQTFKCYVYKNGEIISTI